MQISQGPIKNLSIARSIEASPDSLMVPGGTPIVAGGTYGHSHHALVARAQFGDNHTWKDYDHVANGYHGILARKADPQGEGAFHDFTHYGAIGTRRINAMQSFNRHFGDEQMNTLIAQHHAMQMHRERDSIKAVHAELAKAPAVDNAICIAAGHATMPITGSRLSVVADIHAIKVTAGGHVQHQVVHITHVDEQHLYAQLNGRSNEYLALEGYTSPMLAEEIQKAVSQGHLELALGACHLRCSTVPVRTAYVIVKMVASACRKVLIPTRAPAGSGGIMTPYELTRWHCAIIGHGYTNSNELPSLLTNNLSNMPGLYMICVSPLLLQNQITGHGYLIGMPGITTPYNDDHKLIESEWPRHARYATSEKICVKVVTVDDVVTQPGIATMKQKDRSSDMYDGLHPGAPYDINEDGSATIITNLVAVDDKWAQVEDRTFQSHYELAKHHRKTVLWKNGPSEHGVTAQLAPAFAAITATWLDRNALAALTTGSNWAGGSRTGELEPQTRAALRSAAHTPVELTRLYVRLWAMAVGAAAAYAGKREYRIEAVSGSAPRIIIANSYQDWAAGLTNSVNRHHASIYYDASSTCYTDDILPVLAAAASLQVTDGAIAKWMWPNIPNFTITTNVVPTELATSKLTYHAIVSTIDWLTASTNTSAQANYAAVTVLASTYRPQNTNHYFTTGADNVTTYRLPAMSTAGQYILPLTLWATTVEIGGNPVSPAVSPLKLLRQAATYSSLYGYGLKHASCALTVPNWWGTGLRKVCAPLERRANNIYSNGWHVAVAASSIVAMLGVGIDLSPMHHVYPQSYREVHRIAATSSVTVAELLPHSATIPDSDALSALFSRVTLKPPPVMSVGHPLRIAALAPAEALRHASQLLHDAGATIGYAVMSRAMGDITSMHTCPRDPGCHRRMPDVELDSVTTIPYVNFTTQQQYMAALQISHRRANATWYTTRKALFKEHTWTDQPSSATGPDPEHASRIEQQPHAEVRPLPEQGTDDTAGVDAATEAHEDTSEPGDEQLIDDMQAHADNIPQTIVADSNTAGPIWLMREAAIKGGKPALVAMRDELDGWEIPRQYANDTLALQWIRDGLQYYTASTHMYIPTTLVAGHINKINEQIMLNIERDRERMGIDLTKNGIPQDLGDSAPAVAEEHVAQSPPAATASQPLAAPATFTTNSGMVVARNASDWPELTIEVSP